MTQRNRRRTRLILQSCLGAALLAWAVHGLARIEAPRASGARASMGYGPIAPPAVARRVPADVSARLALDPSRPGPMIRVLEGDRVTLTVVNPPDADEARAVGLRIPAGEGDVNVGPVGPGEQAAVEFVAAEPGLYACTVTGGTTGLAALVLVEPLYGYRRADREFFIVLDKGGTSVPAEASLAAEPGRRIRLFVGNAGDAPATLSVGGQVTEVSSGGEGLPAPLPSKERGLEPGGTLMLEVDLGEAGEVELLARVGDAEATRTVLRVEEMKVAEDDPADAAGGADLSPELKAKMAAGKAVYDRTCIACHQATGLGIPGVYPPLAQSDYLIADVDRAIVGVIKGQQGEIVVNGATYNMLMPPQLLNDEEIAQVVTYVMNSWGNPGEDITVERVAGVRAAAE